MKNSLLKNSIFKSLLSIFNIIIPLIIGPYVTRLFDMNIYGVFNRVLAEINVFIVIGSFGIYNYGVKEISKIRNNQEKVSELFTNLFVISIITNIIVTVLYFIFCSIMATKKELLLYGITSIQFLANIIYVEYVNEAIENYSFITIKTLVVRLLYLIFVLLFIKNPQNIYLYCFIYSFVILINNLSSFLYVKKHIKFCFRKLQIKKYIKPLLLIFLISSVEILYFQLDKVMLGRLVNDISVTIYQIPYMIMSMIITIPTAVVSVSIPRLSNILANKSKREYIEKLNSVLSYFLILLLPICFGIFALSKEIIILYTGGKYLESINILKIFSIVRIIIGLESFMTLLIIYINNKEKKLLYIFGGIGLLNMICNYIIYKLNVFNPLTASLSTGILYLILVILEYIYILKTLNIKLNFFTKNNLVYLLTSISFLLISKIVHYYFTSIIYCCLVCIIICCLVYFGTLYLMKDSILINTLTNLKNKISMEKKK